MTKKEIVTADRIKKAVSAVKAERPAYAEILAFYENIFLAQEDTKGHIDIEPIQVPKDLLSVKLKERLPLINRADFAVDVKASEALLRKICQLAAKANKVLAESSSKIMDALDKGRLEASGLFSKILSEDDTCFDGVTQKLEIDRNVLVFFAYSSITPSVCLCAEQLATYLDKETPWEKGYCPVCGSLPALSILRGEGERSLVCSFCSHEWEAPRICCPFFFSEEEKNYRVDVCDNCHKYIKTVDARKTDRPVNPFVEQISTLHLDMLAQEEGLESGIPLWLQT